MNAAMAETTPTWTTRVFQQSPDSRTWSWEARPILADARKGPVSIASHGFSTDAQAQQNSRSELQRRRLVTSLLEIEEERHNPCAEITPRNSGDFSPQDGS
jgi:hypothetical protein